MYEILLFVHVMGAIMWIGAGLMFQTLSERAVATGERERIVALANVNGHLGKFYFMIAPLLVLAAGIGLVETGDWGWTDVFILGGLIGFVITSVIGGAFIGKAGEGLRAAVANPASPDGELVAGMKRLRNIGRVDLLVTTTIVFLMTVKPWQ